MEIQIRNQQEIGAAVDAFLPLLEKHKIFAFSGDLGAGKTTFISELLKRLGVDSSEGSPTYSLVNAYLVDGKECFHFDFYRIDDAEEAYDIGVEEMMDDEHFCFIEWPEKIEEILPDSTIWVYIRVKPNAERTISVEL